MRLVLFCAAAIALAACAGGIVPPVTGSGCLGVSLDPCLASLRAAFAVQQGFVADALERRHRIDVNGRRLGSGLVPITATLPGRLETLTILLHLTPDDRVIGIESTLLADPTAARTEAEYAKTGLYEIVSRLLGRRCAGTTPIALYRFFENSVKPQIKIWREDTGGIFSGHKRYAQAERVPFCGVAFSYGSLLEWSGSNDPDFSQKLSAAYTIRLE